MKLFIIAVLGLLTSSSSYAQNYPSDYVKTIATPSNITHMAASQDGNYLFAVAIGADQLLAIDTRTDEIVASVGLGDGIPMGVVASNKSVFVGDVVCCGSTKVTRIPIIDTADSLELGPTEFLSVGNTSRPIDFAIIEEDNSPNNRLYISSNYGQLGYIALDVIEGTVPSPLGLKVNNFSGGQRAAWCCARLQ